MDSRQAPPYYQQQQYQQYQQQTRAPQQHHQQQDRGRHARFSWQQPPEEQSPLCEDEQQDQSSSQYLQQHESRGPTLTPRRYNSNFSQMSRLSIPTTITQSPPLSPISSTPISPTPQERLLQQDKLLEAGRYFPAPQGPHPASWTPPQQAMQQRPGPHYQSSPPFEQPRQPPKPPTHAHEAIPSPVRPQLQLHTQPPAHQPQQLQHAEHADAPPLSPGPLPMKSALDEREKKVAQPQSQPRLTSGPVKKDPLPSQFSGAKPIIYSPDSFGGPNGNSAVAPSNGDPPLNLAHQPGQIAHPNMNLSSQEGDTKEWKSSMCGCSGGDASTCLTGMFCPCIVYGKTAYRLSQKAEHKDPTDLLGWQAVNARCGVMSAACGLWWIFPLIHRTRIRHAYHIAGSVPSDLIRSCCCCCCVVLQNEREVRMREDSARRWAGPATGGYSAHSQMVYAPPPRS